MATAWWDISIDRLVVNDTISFEVISYRLASAGAAQGTDGLARRAPLHALVRPFTPLQPVMKAKPPVNHNRLTGGFYF